MLGHAYRDFPGTNQVRRFRYATSNHEVSTAGLIQAALQLENASVFPVPIHHKGRMEFVEYDPNILERHALVFAGAQ